MVIVRYSSCSCTIEFHVIGWFKQLRNFSLLSIFLISSMNTSFNIIALNFNVSTVCLLVLSYLKLNIVYFY